MKIWNTTQKEPFNIGISHFADMNNHVVKLTDAVILFCERGSAKVEINMCEYELVPYTQVIFLPDSIIQINRMDDDFSASFVTFTSLLLWEASTLIDPLFFGMLKENPCITLLQSECKPIRNFIAAVSLCYEDADNKYRLTIVRNIIQCFLLDLYNNIRRCRQKRQESYGRQEELFKQFVQLIHKYCSHEREVNFYAQKLFITPRYLSTVVRNVTGTTAKELIDKHVILEVKASLKATNLNIQEISYKFGFPNHSFFGRYFKKHTGISPLQYREKG